MARTARVVVEGMPHHVIQRGNRRQKVFFNDEDRLNYLKILKEQTELHGLIGTNSEPAKKRKEKSLKKKGARHVLGDKQRCQNGTIGKITNII